MEVFMRTMSSFRRMHHVRPHVLEWVLDIVLVDVLIIKQPFDT